jgi:hypothetical protein
VHSGTSWGEEKRRGTTECTESTGDPGSASGGKKKRRKKKNH